MTFAILFGGKSFEHEISIVSAIALKKYFSATTKFIFISGDREFYLVEPQDLKASFFASGAYKKAAKLTLAQGGFLKSGLFGSSRVECDMVVNLVHGADGEDGKLSGMMDFFGVRYIGPGVEASVLSFSKYLTKIYAHGVGVQALDYRVLHKHGDRKIDLALPVIVKPLRLGSSIGVGVVRDETELDYALDVAFEFDDEVLIEPFIGGVKEYNLAGCMVGDEFRFSIVEEPAKNDFLDFDKKYRDFGRSSRAQEAQIDEGLSSALRKAFKKLYGTLFCGALIRCDFFVIEREIYINEINPIPGSMAHYLFEDFTSVVDGLSRSVPPRKNIGVNYRYIHDIHAAKGKA